MYRIITKTKKMHGMYKNIKLLAVSLALMCLVCIMVILRAYAVEEARITLTVKQVLTSDSAFEPPEQVFTYQLTPKTPGAPMPDGSSPENYTFTIDSILTVQIGPITYSTSGTYIYELNCISGTVSGYTCDKQVYTINVYVNSDMTTSVIVYKDNGSKAEEIEYIHVYKHGLLPSDPEAMVDPKVVKTLTGNPVPVGVFTFQLTAEDPSNPMPSGSTNGIKTIQITGSGQAEFGTWAYTAEGIYLYTITEINSGAKGYTYDTAVYTITDSVKAENGQLVVDRVVTNSSKQQVTSLPFINTYSGGGGGGTTTKPTPTPTPSPTTPPPDTPEDPTPTPSPNDPSVPGKPIPPSDRPDNNYDGKKDGNPPLSNAPGGPKTGDGSVVIPYTILFCISGITALGSAVYLMTRKRRGNTNEN